jgi:hypothetical protein
MDGLKEQVTGMLLVFAGAVHGGVMLAFFPLIYGIGRAVGEPRLFGTAFDQAPALVKFGGETYVGGWQRLGSAVTGGHIPLPHDPVYSGGGGGP